MFRINSTECQKPCQCLHFSGESSEAQKACGMFWRLYSQSLPRQDLSRGCDCNSFRCVTSLEMSTVFPLSFRFARQDVHVARDCKKGLMKGRLRVCVQCFGMFVPFPHSLHFSVLSKTADLPQSLLLEESDPGCNLYYTSLFLIPQNEIWGYHFK